MRGLFTLPILLALLSTPAAASEHGCVGVPDHWWPGDAHPLDVTGGQDGSLADGADYGAGQAAGDAGSFRFAPAGYVSVPDSPMWGGPAPFSVEFWVLFTTLGGSHGESFIGQSEGAGLTAKWWFYLDGGNLGVHLNDPSLGPQFRSIAPFAPALGQWYHLAFVVDGGTVAGYIDGALAGTAHAVPPFPDPAAALQFGQQEGIAQLSGNLDEISLWHQALSGGAIAALAAGGWEAKCGASAEPVPELATLALAGVGLLVVGAGLVARRR